MMKLTVLRWLCCLLPFGALAQSPSFLSAINKDSIPEVYLTVDWKALIKNKQDKEYRDAILFCRTLSSVPVDVKAKVRTRGHMRLNICEFPPLKIKLDKHALQELKLADYNEFDIVHHCEGMASYTQLILREYLAYKIWELISPLHLKTQLIRLHYLNPDGTAAFAPDIAFLVEDQDEFAERTGVQRIRATTMHKGALDKEAMLRVCLFQFMIGNTDWYVSNSHNLEFFGTSVHPLLQIVPYDFDYAGLVNAPYSAHHESIKLTSTSIRYYQGWCESLDEVNREVAAILSYKERILQLPHTIPGLDERSIRYTTEYLQAFFDIIENPKKLENQVVKHCDMWPVKN